MTKKLSRHYWSFNLVVLSISVKMKLAILSALLIAYIIELCQAYTCIFHDSEGNKLSDFNASNWTECGQACGADPSCKFYTFWNKNLTIPGWHHHMLKLKKNQNKYSLSKKISHTYFKIPKPHKFHSLFIDIFIIHWNIRSINCLDCFIYFTLSTLNNLIIA